MTSWFRHIFAADRATLRKSAKIVARHVLHRIHVSNDNCVGEVA